MEKNDVIETVVVQKKEWEQLKADSMKLMFLEQYGVDKWIGYDDANQQYWKWKDNQDDG